MTDNNNVNNPFAAPPADNQPEREPAQSVTPRPYPPQTYGPQTPNNQWSGGAPPPNNQWSSGTPPPNNQWSSGPSPPNNQWSSGTPPPNNQWPPQPGNQQPYYQNRAYTSVNGGLILGLGIASIFIHILAPVAWIMGNGALQQIDAGVGDPYERSSVNTGRTIGMVVTILLLVGVAAVALFFITVAIVAASNMPNGHP